MGKSYSPFEAQTAERSAGQEHGRVDSQWFQRGSIRIPAGSAKTREALAQYIVRPPVSLEKLLVDEGGPDTVV
jgi:hypothetical protein